MGSRHFMLGSLLSLCLAAQPAGEEELPGAQTGAGLRVEHFVIYTRRTQSDGSAALDVSGFVALRRRETADGSQLERDTRFLVGDFGLDARRSVQRVVQVECPAGRGPRCSWRELGSGTGRTVQADWTDDGSALEITEWSTAAKRRGTLVASAGASMPLYLLELLRNGRLVAGHVVAFDPLALTLEQLEVRTTWLDDNRRLGVGTVGDDAVATTADGAPPAARTVDLVRTDGTLAARYRFVGLELTAFQWQEGPVYARRMSEAEYESLLSQHTGEGTTAGRDH